MKCVNKLLIGLLFHGQMRLWLFFCGWGWSYSSAFAEQVRHLFDSQTSSLSLQTEGACGLLAFHAQAERCNPALIRQRSESTATMELMSLADEPTFRSLWKLVKEPVSATDVQNLFAHQSFASFSGYGHLQTSSKWLSLAYTPISLTGAYRITNPSLPLIQAAGIQKSIFSVASAIELRDFVEYSPVNLSIGSQIRYIDGVRATIEVDAITAASTDRKNVVAKKKLGFFDGDLGMSVITVSPWIPRVGMVLQNLAGEEASVSGASTLQIDEPESKKASVHGAWVYSPGIGTAWLSSALFWDGIFARYRWEKAAVSLGYNIGLFTMSTSFSPARFGWGFQVRRGYYHIAMQYAREKQPAYFQVEYQQKLYLGMGVAL